MPVDYNNISKEFAKSRKNMKWEELQYFFENYVHSDSKKKILDVGCGSGRLLEQLGENFPQKNYDYLGVDASSGMIEEAQKNFPEESFTTLDMLDIDTLKNEKYDYIFFIASFHHLDSLEKREEVIQKLQSILTESGIVFFTNWSLKSENHREKYKKDELIGSENQFGSTDFSIKFGEYDRYYHCFSLSELAYLFEKSGFEILENREFDSKKNFISIVKKK